MCERPPMMRRLHATQSRKHIIIGLLLGVTSSTLWYLKVVLPRRKAYEDYYKTFDPIKSFEAIRDGGWFQSCRPVEEAD